MMRHRGRFDGKPVRALARLPAIPLLDVFNANLIDGLAPCGDELRDGGDRRRKFVQLRADREQFTLIDNGDAARLPAPALDVRLTLEEAKAFTDGIHRTCSLFNSIY